VPPPAQASYGIDAPPVVFTFVAIAFVLTFLGIFIGSGTGLPLVALAIWIPALVCWATAIAMVRGSKVGKPELWRRLLDDAALRGDEDALDVGCGRGLVLIETAKRLPRGRATGVDVWRSADQSGNQRAVTELNARIEGVEDRVEIVDGDMTALPFPDGAFDLVTASLAIHNVRDEQGRAQALAGIVRVLRPGGRIIVVDIAKTEEYVDAFAAAGLTVERGDRSFASYPVVRIVTATKPR